MANYRMIFGAYAFQSGFSIEKIDRSAALPVTKLARYHGSASIARKLQAVEITLAGKFMAGWFGVTNPRDAFDTLASAVAQDVQNLYHEPDRYYRNVQCDQLVETYHPTSKSRYCMAAVKFIAKDPFKYECTQGAIGSPGTPITRTALDLITHLTINNSFGLAPALPVFTLNYPTAGVTTATTVTNTTTGEDFIISGVVPASKTVVVDCLNQTVTDGGSNDETALFEDLFVSLNPGNNVFTVTGSNLPSTIIPSWLARWW